LLPDIRQTLRGPPAQPLSWLEKQQGQKCSALLRISCLKPFDRLARICDRSPRIVEQKTPRWIVIGEISQLVQLSNRSRKIDNPAKAARRRERRESPGNPRFNQLATECPQARMIDASVGQAVQACGSAAGAGDHVGSGGQREMEHP
jgi:hypothetical protein